MTGLQFKTNQKSLIWDSSLTAGVDYSIDPRPIDDDEEDEDYVSKEKQDEELSYDSGSEDSESSQESNQGSWVDIAPDSKNTTRGLFYCRSATGEGKGVADNASENNDVPTDEASADTPLAVITSDDEQVKPSYSARDNCFQGSSSHAQYGIGQVLCTSTSP